MRKHDYDSLDFYCLIASLAESGLTDREISGELDVACETFCKMKNGNYTKWTEKDNRERSRRIRDALCKGRLKIVPLVRATYLRAALGGKIIKSVMREYIETVDADGNPIGDRVLHQTTERTRELPPSLKALAKWLYHFDADWRRIERSRRTKMFHGNNGDIEAWLMQNTTALKDKVNQ